MDLGIGFLVGVMGGALVAIVAAIIISASRRAMRRKGVDQTQVIEMRELAEAMRTGGNPRQAGAAPAAASASASAAAGDPTARRGQGPTRTVGAKASTQSSGSTMIINAMDSREDTLNKSIKDVRELLLRLADAISGTESASGEAASAFKTAKDAIHKINLSASSELAEAQAALIREIDRVVQSNAKLHTELDKANQGIAQQRRQIEELRVQARIDALTRIPNRAAFDERLDEYISLLERTNLAFTLMLVDIDHFKQINDTHGHVNGDRILSGVAAKLSDSVRGVDFAARYGGEEFAVIFPGTDANEALVVAERVRQDIAKTNFRLDTENVRITVSGGLAECRKGMEPSAIIAEADGALYQAKSGGRNQILTPDGGDSRNVERL